MNLFKKRAFRQGTFATAITIFGVMVILVLNFVFSTLSNNFNWRIDLTEERMFEITQESIDFLATLDKDVNIFVLNTEDEFVNAAQPFTFQANEVIRKYEFFGERVNLEYVDLIRNPTFVARFAELDLLPNQILVESPQTGRHKIIGFHDLFNIVTGQGGQATVRSSRAEQVMTSAILNVTSDRQIRISVLSGYNQAELPAFINLLEMNNSEIVHENLFTIEDIDSEATIALLIAPARDITEDDLRKIDRFLNNNNEYGRTLFFITGADHAPMSQMPNLSAWLAEWGISVGDDALFEMDPSYRFFLDNPYISFVNYSTNPLAQDLSHSVRAQDLLAVSFNSNPISILFAEQGARRVYPLLQTTEFSGVFPEHGDLTEYDFTGPHPMLALSTITRFQGVERLNAHVLVSSSWASFSPAVLGEMNFANSEYFLEVLDTLAQREDTVRIQDKTFSIATIQTTLAQNRIINVFFIVLLPVGLLASGIVVWLIRRHR